MLKTFQKKNIEKTIKCVSRVTPLLLVLGLTVYLLRGVLFAKGISFYGDTGAFHLNMANLQNLANYLWVDKYTGPGIYSSLPAFFQNLFSLNLLFTPLSRLINNQEILNMLWIGLPYFTFAIALFYFLRLFVKSSWLSAIGVAGYMFTYIYFRWFISYGSNIMLWSLTGALIFSIVFIKNLTAKTEKETYIYSVIALLASFAAISNIAYFYTFVIFLIVYTCIYFIQTTRDQYLQITRSCLKMATVVGIGHLFWIVPIYFMRSNFASVFGSQADPIFQYFSGLSGSLKNLIYITDDIDPSKRSLYAALALLLFGVAAIGVLVKKNKERIGLLASFIVLYALSFGASSPFWKITSHIPGSFLLRTPQRVFILMLALFLALILGVIEDNLHNIRGKACLAFLLLFIATNAYYHLGNYAPFTLKNEIPSTYNKVAKILESKPSNDYRTIVFPRMGSFVKYSWAKNPRVSISLIDLYTNAKITRWWMNEESVPEIIKPLFDNAFYAKTSNNPNAVLAFFGYKYILFQKDITIVDGSKYQPTQQNVTEKVKHTVAFNDTNVTILENQYPIRPSVYAATESVKAVNDNDALRQIENDQSLQKSLGIVAPETITGKLTGAVTEYRKANPSRYTVTLKGLTDRGLLILQEQFHPGWEAYSQDRTKSVASVRHLQVNSFENGWLIDTTTLCKEVSCNINKDGTKSVTLSLEYTPQRYFDALEILTLLEIFLVTLYIGILSRRPQNDKD